MTRIDFYILDSSNRQARSQLACRLVEKAYSLDHHVYIYTDDETQTEQLDNLLWTFRQGSFIPHERHAGENAPAAPILLGHQAAPENHNQVLINLHENVPMFFSRFERVVEIIDQDENVKQLGRERFKFYRDRGYDLHTHNVTG